MQTTDQVAGEAREKLAGMIEMAVFAQRLQGDATMEITMEFGAWKEVIAALRAQPERGAEEMAAGEERRNLADALEVTATYSGGTATDLAVLTRANLPVILAALRYQPEEEVEEARDILQGLDPRFTFEEHVAFLRRVADQWTGATRENYHNRADKIEAAIRALPLHPAKDEGGGHG